MSSIWNNLKLVILSPWIVTARFLNQPATFLEVKDHQHDLDQPPILHMEKWLKDAQLARQSWQTHHAAPGGGDGQRMVTFKSMRTPALMLVTIDWILLRAKEGAACFMGFISFHSYNDPIRWPYYSHFTDENTEMQRNRAACRRSHSGRQCGWTSNPALSDSRVQALRQRLANCVLEAKSSILPVVCN